MFWNLIFSKKNRSREQKSSSATIDSGTVKATIVSDLGNIRTNNEDVGLFFRIADERISSQKGLLLIVADGMGGHNAGEVASRMAADIISHEYFKQHDSVEKSLLRSFEKANKNIFETAAANSSCKGMGTTCTVLVINDDSVYYGHVGDSRAYLIRNNSIVKITQDHTHVNDLVKSGEITAEEADSHPQRNILTNALGTKPVVKVDTGKCEFQFQENDRLLLCSDGLYDYLKDEELLEMQKGQTLSEAANKMIVETKKRGAHDNITIVLAEKNEVLSETATKETRDFNIPVTKEYDLS